MQQFAIVKKKPVPRNRKAGITLITTTVALLAVSLIALAITNLNQTNLELAQFMQSELIEQQQRRSLTELARPNVAAIMLNEAENGNEVTVYLPNFAQGIALKLRKVDSRKVELQQIN